MPATAKKLDVEQSMDVEAQLALLGERTVTLQKDVTEIKSNVSRIDAKLGATAEKVAALEPKLDGLATSVGAKLDSLDTKLNGLMALFDAKLNGLTASFDAKLSGLTASFDAKLDGLAASFDAKLDGLAASFDAKLSAQSAGLEAKLEAMEKRLLKGVFRSLMTAAATVGGLCFGLAKLFS
jgi:hypothetical protein